MSRQERRGPIGAASEDHDRAVPEQSQQALPHDAATARDEDGAVRPVLEPIIEELSHRLTN